jgi:Undecaprenyl-phosphate galactose phosphotransferase WbaP
VTITTGSARRPFPAAANARLLRERRFARPGQRRIIVALGLLSVDAIAAVTTSALVSMLFGFALRGAAFAALPVLLGSFTLAGLYRSYWRTPYDRLRARLIGSFIYAVAIPLISLEAIPDIDLTGVICMTAAVFIVGFYAELGLRHILISYGLWGGATAFVGGDRTIEYAYRLFSTVPEFGLKPTGCLTCDKPLGTFLRGVLPLLGRADDLVHLRPREIEFIVTSTEADYARLSRAVQPLPSPPTVLLIGGNPTRENSHLRSKTIMLEAGRDLNAPSNRLMRRTMDLVLTLPAMLLALPLIGILAALIKLMNPGPAFYFQTRVGRNDRSLRIVKLRTMHCDAEERLESHLKNNLVARAEWDRFCKLSHDPRVLPYIGNFIRRMSLDEVPQLWNVLRGEISLIGPRPFPSYHTQRFDLEFRKLRSSVLPGLTGLWQVSSRSNGDLRTQEVQDLYYIRNWSMWLDVYILLQTVEAVVRASGAR